MKEAIYLRSQMPVKAWLDESNGKDWYLIEFENGATINCYKTELKFI